MASFFSKIGLDTAQFRRKNRQDWSCNTLTTLDFFRLSVVYRQPLFEGDKVDIDASNFFRLQPQVKPLLGSGRVVNRAFFVPFRLLCKGFNEFSTGTPYRSANLDYIPSSAPYMYMKDIFDYLIYNSYNLGEDDYSITATEFNRGSLNSGHDVPAYDFAVPVDYDEEIPSTTLYYPYQFESKARLIYNLLISLGYKVIFPSVNLGFNSTEYQSLKVNAIPLLAYLKVWADWYSNPSYENEAAIDKFFQLDCGSDIFEDSSTFNFDIILRTLQVCYDSDYFTSQWDNPQGPNVTSASSVSMLDLQPHYNREDDYYYQSRVVQDQSGTPILEGVESQSDGTITDTYPRAVSLSQFSLDALKRLTDFVRRKQIVGNRVIDNFLAQFGVENHYERLQRSQLIQSFDTPIQFGEVLATTDNSSESQVLGSQAGRAIGSSKSPHITYSVETGDNGLLLILSYIEPKILNCDGIDRFCLDLDKDDFYNPSFDGLGVQATSQQEFKCDYTHYAFGGSDSAILNGIFGYIPRYAHYKVGRDIMSGDFARPMLKESMSVWHMARIPAANLLPKHNYNFCLGSETNSQYNRIFAIQDTDDVGVDNFIGIYSFKVTAYTPKLPLFDNYQFDDEREHIKTTVQTNGTRVQ